MANDAQLTTQEKIQAYIRERGVTRCEPVIFSCNVTPTYRQKIGNCGLSHQLNDQFEAMPESRLAKAKLVVMLFDLAGKGKSVIGSERELLRHQAYHWFFGCGSDFRCWCESAGYLPEVVLEGARRVWDSQIDEKIWNPSPPGSSKRYAKRKAQRLNQKELPICGK